MKNHTPSAQNTVVAAITDAVSASAGCVSSHMNTDMSQNNRWLKMCVITYSMTDDDALSTPMCGFSSITL